MSAHAPPPSVCLLSGSLRGKKASSFHFLSSLQKQLAAHGVVATRLAVEPGAAHVYSTQTLDMLNDADAVIVASPLYGYCLPGGLMRLLEAWAQYAAQHPQRGTTRFYAIVNCGFVVPETIAEAIRVLKHFCTRLGLEHRLSVAVACGPVAVFTECIDGRLKRAYRAIAADICDECHTPMPDLYLKPLVPRLFMDTIREYLDARVQRNIRRAARRGDAVSQQAITH